MGLISHQEDVSTHCCEKRKHHVINCMCPKAVFFHQDHRYTRWLKSPTINIFFISRKSNVKWISFILYANATVEIKWKISFHILKIKAKLTNINNKTHANNFNFNNTAPFIIWDSTILPENTIRPVYLVRTIRIHVTS